MHDFVLREIENCNMESELNRIGFDSSYIHRAVDKFNYKNIKIYSLTPAQANILKQTAISLGADCATHREVITGKAEVSNCILTGSISQLAKIADKLQYQPFGLKDLAEKLRKIKFDSPLLPKIVGILNITDNSSSDGGLYNDFEKAKEHIIEMINDGADIIDMGAESTKPYSASVDAKVQIEKLLPLIDFAKDKIILSIDTRSAEVARECIKAGAKIINDVSGLDYDNEMVNVAAKYNVPIIIQHSKGTPENMQDNPHYDDVIEEIFMSLNDKIKFARSKGVENIIVDAGIGFGKSREDNFEIIGRAGEFKSLGYPVMLGISRKSFLGSEDNEERDIYTTAINALLCERGVDYIRVHNVKMHKTLIDLMKMFMIK